MYSPVKRKCINVGSVFQEQKRLFCALILEANMSIEGLPKMLQRVRKMFASQPIIQFARGQIRLDVECAQDM